MSLDGYDRNSRSASNVLLGDDFDEEEDYDDSELTQEERMGLCRAFALLDADGDGVIDLSELDNLLISWGRLPMDKEKEEIMSYVTGEGCEGAFGMDLENFRKYVTDQLAGTRDEDELRQAFEMFDSNPPTGCLNLVELRHYLKQTGMKLTDDEIDFLYREEDYWMLDKKYNFEFEELINKIMGKPINSMFLNF